MENFKELTYYSLNKYIIITSILILTMVTTSIIYIKIISTNAYYERLNIPIPFFYFIGNNSVIKKNIEEKIYNLLENKGKEGFTDINNEPNSNVKYYYITDLVNNLRTFVISLTENTKKLLKTTNDNFINTQKNIQHNAQDITGKLYTDFVKPKTHIFNVV